MRNEVSRLKARRTQVLKDKNLTKEEFDKLDKKYQEMIIARQKQINEYLKESEIPQQLQ